MKKTAILFLLFAGLQLKAQNLDSLYNSFLSIRGVSIKESGTYQVQSNIGEHEKCAFGLVNQIISNYDRFTDSQKTVLSQLLTRPASDTSIVSPSGKFRIHYSKKGLNAPGYDLNELAVAADSAYNYEVMILGYPAPPSDLGEGGDDKYDIYIENLQSNTYGYTEGESAITDSTYTSYMVIDNDFSNYYTKGINAAKVTVAHEFHHAIQMGNYILRLDDQFYYELTSTSMEEFVFTDVNDYYHDLSRFLSDPNFSDKPQNAFASNTGYDLAIWNIFMKSQFDIDIIKRTWEFMKDHDRALIAVANAIAERGSNFKIEFAKFGLWLYFTGPRAVPGKYFPEAANYPLVKPYMTLPFAGHDISLNIDSFPVSTNIIVFTDNTGSGEDTLVAVISNSDLTNGVNRLSTTTNFKYTLTNAPGSGYRSIVNGFYSKLESSGDFLFTESNIFNNYPVESGQIVTTEIDYAFPQPFRYSQNRIIYFPVSLDITGIVDLAIYSVDMRRIYSGQANVLALDKAVIQWNCLDNSGAKLGSGVYFYVIKSGDKIKKGKFVVLNE